MCTVNRVRGDGKTLLTLPQRFFLSQTSVTSRPFQSGYSSEDSLTPDSQWSMLDTRSVTKQNKNLPAKHFEHKFIVLLDLEKKQQRGKHVFIK